MCFAFIPTQNQYIETFKTLAGRVKALTLTRLSKFNPYKKMQPPNTNTQRRLLSVKEWSIATRAVIIGIIIQSFLQNLMDFLFPAQSEYKILFWAAILVGASVFFTFLDSLLDWCKYIFVDPVVQKWSVSRPAHCCIAVSLYETSLLIRKI